MHCNYNEVGGVVGALVEHDDNLYAVAATVDVVPTAGNVVLKVVAVVAVAGFVVAVAGFVVAVAGFVVVAAVSVLTAAVVDSIVWHLKGLLQVVSV